MTNRHLTLIQGSPAPDTAAEHVRKRVRAADKPAELVQCHRCGGRELLETRLGMTRKNGKIGGGTKCLICAACWLNGERVVIT